MRDWWRPHHTYGVLVPMRPGITAALWLGPAQEYSRYRVVTGEARMTHAALDTFADAAWNMLRSNGIEETARLARSAGRHR